MTNDSSMSFLRRLAIVLGLLVSFILLLVILTHLPLPVKVSYGTMIYAAVAFVLAVALTLLAQKFWRGGTESVFKPDRETVYRFFMGLLIGAGVTLGIMYIIGKYSGVKIYRNPVFNPLAFGSGCGAIFMLAWAEEITFRGYALSSLRKPSSVWISQAIIAVFFIIYQVTNGWALHEAIIGPGAWALFYGLVAMQTGGIAQSTGMHFAANLTQSLVGTGQFAFFSISRDIVNSPDMPEDIRKSGAWTQFILLIIILLLTARYARRVRMGKAS